MRNKNKKQQPDTIRRRVQSEWERPAAYSYRSQRAERPEAAGRQNASLALKRKRILSLQYWARRSGILVAFGGFVVVCISIASLSTTPKVTLTEDGAGSYAYRDAAMYEQAAADFLAESVWNRNKVTVDAGALSEAMRSQFPELASARLTVPFIGHHATLELAANEPALILQAANGSFVLDTTGKVLLAKDALPSSALENLPIVADQTGARPQFGQQAVASQEVQFIRIVVDTLSAKGIRVVSLALPAQAAQELYVQVADKPYTIKFNLHEANRARQQVGTYIATEERLAGQQITPGQYIDVRVPGRAYYL